MNKLKNLIPWICCLAILLISSVIFVYQQQNCLNQNSKINITSAPEQTKTAEPTVIVKETVEADGQEFIFTQTCDGQKLFFTQLNKLPYCIGENNVLITDQDGNQKTLVTVQSTSIDDAPLLTQVARVRAIGKNNDKILFGFMVLECTLTDDTCGVGIPWNNINYVYNPFDQKLSVIKYYPGTGTPIWNQFGTKALFPVVQVGGAGCESGSPIGYNLETDTVDKLTKETACEFSRGAADVEGNPMPEWGTLYWSGTENGKETFTTTILNPDGTWKEITGSF